MSYEGLPHEEQNWHKDHRWNARKPTGRMTYKYCQKHDRVEKVTSRCHKQRAPVAASAAVHTFKPFYHTELGPKPVYIDSKATYRRECAKVNGICPV